MHTLRLPNDEEEGVTFGSEERKSSATFTALFAYLTLDCLRFMVLLK